MVATQVGSVAETVHHGQTGFLTTPGDAEEIATHWQALLESPDLAHHFGAAGRQRVVASWSLEQMVEGYQSLIEEVYQQKYPPRHCPLPGSGEPRRDAELTNPKR